MRVALVTNIPSPYRLPVWDAVAKGAGQLRVFAFAESEANRIWKVENLNSYAFEYHQLQGRSRYISSWDWGIHWNPGLWNALLDFQPTHIVVTGYEAPSYLMAIAFAKVHRLPLVIWWGSHLLSSRFRRGIIAWLRRHIVRLADAYLTYGTMATNYLISMGVHADRIVTGVNTVDVQKVSRLVNALRSQERVFNKGRVHFLYVGQLIARKGVQQLLEAFRFIPKEKARLTIVGYGPLEEKLKAFAEAQHMDNIVFAGGTHTLEETAEYYANADVLVMPSLAEVWGLVINEALAAGLWVLASKYAGATYDLIDRAPVRVGQSFDPLKLSNFRKALLHALAAASKREVDSIMAWGLRHTPEKYANALLMALKKAEA